MSDLYSKYKLHKQKVEVKVEEVKIVEEVKEEVKKEDVTVKPNIINKYVNDALGINVEPVRKGSPLQKRSSLDNQVIKNEEIVQRIEKQLNTTKEALISREREKERISPLQKKITPKKVEVGLPNVEYEVHDNIKFMREFQRHELKHKDHSSIIVAKNCLRKYFYREVINVIPTGVKNIFFPWGSAFHLFKQRLSELYGYGDNEPKKFDEEKAKAAFKQAAQEGTKYWLKYGEDQKPDTKYDWFTAERLYESFKKAYEFWVKERKENRIKVMAVEQYFCVELPDGRFVQGRVDETIIKDDELWGRDFKTTQKTKDWFEKGLRPNNQVRTYSYGNSRLANRETRGLLIQTLYNAKSTKKGQSGPEVYEFIVEVTDYELEQWQKEQAQWNDILDLCREKDIWPQSEVACQYCEYQQVCEKGTEAAMVHVLENRYSKHLRDPAHIDE